MKWKIQVCGDDDGKWKSEVEKCVYMMCLWEGDAKQG